MTRADLLISGRVQGVWFRESCRRQAEAAAVAGWVRNCADGTVEAWLEGTPTAVEQVTAWCRVGPPRADVVAIEGEERPAAGYTAFDVR